MWYYYLLKQSYNVEPIVKLVRLAVNDRRYGNAHYFQTNKRQSHCRDCPLAFGDILILKLLIFLKCDFNLTVAR